MVRESEVREGEVTVEPPKARDAGLVFIGRIRTPWTSRLATPRQGRHDGPVCRLEIFEPWVPALKGVDFYANLEVLYWLHQSRRDLVLQSPKNNKSTRGTFSLRSPVRPNPIATSIVKLVGIEGNVVLVRGLDCLDETPLLDLKPDRCEFSPLAPPQAGDFETERFLCHSAPAPRGASRHDEGGWIVRLAKSADLNSALPPASPHSPPALCRPPCGLPAAAARRRCGAASRACAGETPPVRRR